MSRKPKKYHYIYKTTCTVTGKFYVGMHSSDSLDDGYLGSGKILGYSRRKYGDENHVREILEFCSSRDELKQREKEIVNEALLADPLNINLKYGGEGGWDLVKGVNIQKQKVDPVKRSANAQRTIRERIALIPGYQEQRKLTWSKVASSKKNFNFTGKQHSDKTRHKMSESAKGKHDGQLNSQYGTCWVTKDGRPVKIKKECLAEYIQNGYTRGRK